MYGEVSSEGLAIVKVLSAPFTNTASKGSTSGILR